MQRRCEDLLSVHAADNLDRHGAYSQALVVADMNALLGGLPEQRIFKVEDDAGDTKRRNAGSLRDKGRARKSTEPLSVVYNIEEGLQQRVGLPNWMAP